MADPITMAVVGGSVGAMMSPKDPLKGALLGAAGGYGGGALMGAGGLGAAGAGTASTAAGAGSGLMPGAVGGFGQAVPALGANAVPAAGIFSGGGTSALGGMTGITAPGPSTGLIGSILNQPTFMETISGGFKDIGQYAQQNPYLTQMGMQSAQQMMQQPEAQFAPAGQIQRGGIQDVQIASALPQAPRISLI
jgi:hypothetical protein